MLGCRSSKRRYWPRRASSERQRIKEFLECAKRQRAVVSEVPGLEVYARNLNAVLVQAMESYGVD